MSEEFNKVESMIEQLKAYANTRVSQVKLSMAEKVSKLAAEMIAMLMAALVFFLFQKKTREPNNRFGTTKR